VGCVENSKLLEPFYPFIVAQCRKYFEHDNTIHLDLANHIYLTFVDLPTERIETLINNKELNKYLATSIRNERYNKTSRFRLLYSREVTGTSLQDHAGNDELSFNNLNRLTDFEKKILSLFVKYGSYESAAKASRISNNTLIKYIKHIKKKLQ
jgi:hypothetical protein